MIDRSCIIGLFALAVTGGQTSAAITNTGDRNADPAPRAAPAMVPVGPGNTDSSPRQIVRSSRDILYVVAPSGTVYTPGAPATTRLTVYGATNPGTPTGFRALDPAHAPSAGVNASASAIDGQDRIHSLWITPGKAGYGVFDTVAGRWGPLRTLETTGWTNYGQGDEGAAIAVDANGNPHAVWNYVDPATGLLRLHLAIAANGIFGTPQTVDDIDANGGARHPSVAFTPNGDFVVAWVDGDGQYQGQGTVRARVLHPNGQWDASYAVPGVTAGSSLDQSNSLLITADGTRHLTFLDDGNVIQYFYDTLDGQGWRGDQQPPTQITHDPVLGPDGRGGLYIYGHATPLGGNRSDTNGVLIDGLGNGKRRFHKAAGSSVWSAYDLVRDGLIDDASTVRWSQFFHNHPEDVDFTWWNHTPGTYDGSGYYLEAGVETVGGPILAGSTVLQSRPLPPPAENNVDQQAVHPTSAGGTATAFALVAGVNGTAARVGVFIDDTNAASHVAVGMYADAGGRPGTLLAQGTLLGTGVGRGQWHEVALGGAATLVAGQTYWIALLSPQGSGPVAFRDGAAGGASSVTAASTRLTALPASWPAGSAGTDGPLAAYIVGR